jgi:hypothetical protein
MSSTTAATIPHLSLLHHQRAAERDLRDLLASEDDWHDAYRAIYRSNVRTCVLRLRAARAAYEAAWETFVRERMAVRVEAAE